MVPGPLKLGGGLDLGNAPSKRFAPVRLPEMAPLSLVTSSRCGLAARRRKLLLRDLLCDLGSCADDSHPWAWTDRLA
jgi:hypothetical protein